MCDTCGCSVSNKPVRYQCQCEDDCNCNVIEFDKDPKSVPYCCWEPMKRIK